MWVVVETWMLHDRRFPQAEVGDRAVAALAFVPDDVQPPVSGLPLLRDVPELADSITSMPPRTTGSADNRYRVRGRVALRRVGAAGSQHGIEAADLFLVTDDALAPEGGEVDLVGSLDVAMNKWIGAREWLVRDIVLEQTPLLYPADLSSRRAASTATAPAAGERIFTGEQFVALRGERVAVAQGVTRPGGVPDYQHSKQTRVQRAEVPVPRTVGFLQRYLLDLVSAVVDGPELQEVQPGERDALCGSGADRGVV
jgi:hypothetical protein